MQPNISPQIENRTRLNYQRKRREDFRKDKILCNICHTYSCKTEEEKRLNRCKFHLHPKPEVLERIRQGHKIKCLICKINYCETEEELITRLCSKHLLEKKYSWRQ